MDADDRTISDAVQAIVSARPGIQLALSGVLVIETLDEGESAPTLHYYEIGDPTPWAKAGMLHAALRTAGHEIDDGYRDDE